MAESSCSKSAEQKNPVLSFSLNEDSDNVEIIPDIIGEDEYIDLFGYDDAFEDFESFEEELEHIFLDYQTYSTKFFK